MNKRLQPFYYSVIGVVVLIVFWQISVMLLKSSVPIAAKLAPLPAAFSLWDLVFSGEIFPHIAASLLRVGVGLALALCIGVPLGLCAGLSKHFDMLSGFSFQLIRMVSPLAWMPIAVMIFGVGNAPVFFLLSVAAVWTVLLNTTVGVNQIDPAIIELGNSLASTRWEMLKNII